MRLFNCRVHFCDESVIKTHAPPSETGREAPVISVDNSTIGNV